MKNEINEDQIAPNNPLMVFMGVLAGGLVGAVTMTLLAPQSGNATRTQLREKGTDLLNQTNKMVSDKIEQVRSTIKEIGDSGLKMKKSKEIKQRGQELVVEQLDHLSKATKDGKKAIQNA
jgi:gas vesicle protein